MKVTTKFCIHCNARERIIEHGKCIVCGHPPEELWKAATNPPTWGSHGEHVDTETVSQPTAYLTDTPTWVDWVIFLVIVITVPFMIWQVARWVM